MKPTKPNVSHAYPPKPYQISENSKRTGFAVLILLLIAFFAHSAFGATVRATTPERLDYLQRAGAWEQPPWVNGNFEFEDEFDPAQAPIAIEEERILRSGAVPCAFDPNGLSSSTGLSWKFVCHLLNPNPRDVHDLVRDRLGQKIKLKVKYGANNGEVFGEVLATRLLWSLGFYADRMYFLDEVRCFGCGEHPFKDRAVDPTTLQSPRSFSATAIERKHRSHEILWVGSDPAKPWTREGWSFNERGETSTEKAVAVHQRAERDALVLLTIFINHLDNKADNQRLICLDPLTLNGKCSGRTALMLHDVGSTFGGGYDSKIREIRKADFNEWKAKPIWINAQDCQGSVSRWGSQSLSSAHISEGGRQLLLKLLKGFSEGPLGRDRVEALFRTARIEQRGGFSASQWADVFLSKVQEIEFPLGKSAIAFACPN